MDLERRIESLRYAKGEQSARDEAGEASLRAIAARQFDAAGADALAYLGARGEPPCVIGTVDYRTRVRNFSFKGVCRGWYLDPLFRIALTDRGQIIQSEPVSGGGKVQRLLLGRPLSDVPHYAPLADSMSCSLSTGRDWDETSLEIRVYRDTGVPIGGLSVLDWVASRLA